MPAPTVQCISQSTIKPANSPAAGGDQRFHLATWDLAMFNANYIQKGLLFTNLPPFLTSDQILHRLKTSLSAALHHFYPLAGRLLTEHDDPTDGSAVGTFISIDCTAAGAEFLHAVAPHTTVADVLEPVHIPTSLVESFFPLDGAINHDGHSAPLLSVQVTELADGLFVGCSFNHVVGDGTSYWNFFNAWAEFSRSGAISHPPDLTRWFMPGVADHLPIKLPFSHDSQFVEKLTPTRPPLRERMFHFSSESIAKLKSIANNESGDDQAVISSFQALSALVWRAITRARGLPGSQETSCRMAAQNRSRMRPALSPYYFGNTMYPLSVTVTVAELMGNGLGWAARVLNKRVAAHNDEAIKAAVAAWHAAPSVYRMSMFDASSVMMGSSPRFDMYGCDFGWGRAVALRSGSANKFDGKVSSYPGWEGGSSIDLEICLTPENMTALESDGDFMAAVSSPECW